MVDIAGRWVNIITESYSPKGKISIFFKEHKFQFHIGPDLPSLLIIVLRGFLKSIPPYKIISELNFVGFDVRKETQMISRKDGRKLYFFSLTYREMKIKKRSFMFKIRIKVEKYRAPRNINFQQFFHMAQDCNLNPKSDGYGEFHQSLNCPKKTEASDQKPLPTPITEVGSIPLHAKDAKNSL